MTTQTPSRKQFVSFIACSLLALTIATSRAATIAEIENASIDGRIEDGKARLVIEAVLRGQPGGAQKLIFATALNHAIDVSRDRVRHSLDLTIDILQGDPKELPFALAGDGEIRRVTGEHLQDWSIRQETNGVRTLVLRPKQSEKPPTKLAVAIEAEQRLKELPGTTVPLTIVPPQPALFNGYVRVVSKAELDAQPQNTSGLVPIEFDYLPEPLRSKIAPSENTETRALDAINSFVKATPLAFRFHGTGYSLPILISLADPEAGRVILKNFKLTGNLSDGAAAFTLRATAHVKNPKGGAIQLLSGNVGLTRFESNPSWRMRSDNGRYILTFDRPGEFLIEVQFDAGVQRTDSGNVLDFAVAPAALQPIVLRGLAAETEFQFAGAARPGRAGDEFLSYLPADGQVKLAWKEHRPEAEGKLFYAAEMLSQITVSPGLMRQLASFDFKVMQGELNQIALLLRGEGEVTRVQGDNVLAWNVEPAPNSADRRVLVQLNQPQKDQFALQVHVQTPLGAFPQEADAMQLRPEGATRLSGYFRIVNDGAVRLEILDSSGLSQISPEQFPETPVTKQLFSVPGGQRFAYRFSGAEFALRIRADQILPELAVSQVLSYHHAENELSIDAEIELDIREAPLRELLLRVPKGYAVARLAASGMSDYFLHEETSDSELRVVYGQPLSGRQLVQLRLERNQALGNTVWELPRLEFTQAKSVRGHIGASSDAGFRLTPERTESLTEIATAFFPRKLAGIQAAFRLTGAAWTAALRIDRLPQSIQADVFHLFSVGEGVAYGSSLINYAVSGSPLSAFAIELSGEYYNVEFTGKDIRGWQKTDTGYTVQLHTPVSGAYTLLAAYERPFKPQGETLGFAGARPLDAQSEQGYTVVTSAYQFQVSPANVSAALLPLETGEVPTEFRLFFDTPILAAYRYTSRPFNLTLELTPFTQGDSLHQIVDRAALTTRISKESQVLTTARYFVKNRGSPHFRVTLAEGTQLWAATVNGTPVVPVTDAKANLIPLPQLSDPNAVVTVDLKLASRSKQPRRLSVSAPVVAAPILLAEWKIEPDSGQRLLYRKGTVMPADGVPDVSGFAQVARMFRGADGPSAKLVTLAAFALMLLAALVWRWSSSGNAYRYSARQLSGLVVGLISIGLAVAAIVVLISLAGQHKGVQPHDVRFVMPVQQANAALSVEVANIPDKPGTAFLRYGWPAVLALLAWMYGAFVSSRTLRSSMWILGWTLLAWATLRWPNGAPGFFLLIAVFLLLHFAFPTLRRLAQAPPKPNPAPSSPPQTGAAPAVASILLGALIWSGTTGQPRLYAAEAGQSKQAEQSITVAKRPIAEWTRQQIRIEDKFAVSVAKIRWRATQGELLPILFEPAVLTRIAYPTNAMKLVQVSPGSKRVHQLLALESGVFDLELEYHLHVSRKDGEGGFVLPTRHALINEVSLTLVNLDVDAISSHAVSIHRESTGTNTLAKLILLPVDEAWIGWKPRTRNLKTETPVFYAEVAQLYAPSAGVIEGAHHVSIRTAQGELSELVFSVPSGTTITDVTDPADASNKADPAASSGKRASIASLWRFDPETRKLRVTLAAPQSRPFALVVRSQLATGPLPFEQRIGLLSVDNAAGQIGLMGVATGNEVQLDSVVAEEFSAINLEDFPGFVPQFMQGQIQGLTVRRAFRYASTSAAAVMKASPVEPDIRVEAQNTLSLGEDRIVLAANLAVEISRAGIFRLSFALPAGLEVDAISGQALSHWTELATSDGRIVTLHLRGKTEGQQQFAITLAGAGVKPAQAWAVPQLVFREAAKHRGTVVIVPEQGTRLQIATRTGVTQLDPEKAGIRQKGVLVFRILQAPWTIALNIEQVDPWIQVTSLQHAAVSEAQVKVAASLQYQIENTGLKSFRVLLPENAENVRFAGDQISDFRPLTGAATNRLQSWEVKLHRRVIGRYALSVTYHTPVPEQAATTLLQGLQASDVNVQRGYVTLQSSGRIQLQVNPLPPALQPVEWQSIPSNLQKGLPAAPADFAFRLIDPSFQLAMAIGRHEAAKLLPARVTEITFQSVVSDDGVMLTQARLQMVPGDKRLLYMTLPKDARFWFAFVDQHGVWPWREQDRILIPLEQKSRANEGVSTVEIFYSSQAGKPDGRELDLDLIAPKFDLPLENVTWHVYLNEKWQLQEWTGSLQLQEDEIVESAAALDVQTYLQNEAAAQQAKTRQAEQMLNTANTLLERGDPQQARRAFEAAYSLSTHDNAFNEDARVQLHNLKLQQAIVGLNVRQSAALGDPDALTARLRDNRGRNEMNYTQQEAKEIMDRKSPDENSAFTRLAERLVQQQDAAVSTLSAIRASIPEQGRLLTFKRAMVVDTWADLRIGMEAKAAKTAPWLLRISILAATFLVLGVIGWAGKSAVRS